MKFKDCPDQTVIRAFETFTSPPTNKMLADFLKLYGYEDVDEHKVRRRKRDLRRAGLLAPRLVSPTARGESDPDELT